MVGLIGDRLDQSTNFVLEWPAYQSARKKSLAGKSCQADAARGIALPAHLDFRFGFGAFCAAGFLLSGFGF
jgi:hypothetical protein